MIGTYNPDETSMTVEEKAWNALWYEIGRDDLEYADNFRVARKDSPKQMEDYNKRVQRGCCGYMDTHIKIDGVKFIIGCNYGH